MARIDTKAAVIGWPVKQSLSPAIHAFWRAELGVSGAYRRITCEPYKAAFEDTVSKLIKFGYRGANVTIPHKRHAFDVADVKSDTATTLGVANMLSFEDGSIIADNSDVYGFEMMMQELLDESALRKRALVLGAGGAAPAICLALQRLGFDEVIVANRTEEKARHLAEAHDFIQNYCRWGDAAEIVSSADAIVNATSLGMTGAEPLNLDLNGAAPETVVADIVYNPLETELILSARARGLRAGNGLPMLMHQAVPGFRKWFGKEPAVFDSLKTYLTEKLEAKAKRPIKIGLTGSIGMGKTTAAKVLGEEGAAVWDADGAVHRLYAKGGAAVGPVSEAFQGVIENDAVSRVRLADHLAEHPQDFQRLEKIVHPLVAADREVFIAEASARGAKAVVMEIPLLFETGQSHAFDELIVVTADLDVRRRRVLERPGMTLQKFDAIVSRQMPEEEKRMLADHVVFTDRTLAESTEMLRKVYGQILENYGA